MKFKIEHKLNGRIRVKTPYSFTLDEANILKYNLESITGVLYAYVYKKTGNIKIEYSNNSLSDILNLLKDTNINDLTKSDQDNYLFKPQQELELFDIFRESLFRKLLVSVMPAPLKTAYVLYSSIQFIKSGFKSIIKGKVDVDLLDATAISISLLSKEFNSAGSMIALLKLGSSLEKWALQKSKTNLKDVLKLNTDTVLIQKDNELFNVPLRNVKKDDIVLVNMGSVIPVDGIIVDGEGMVNESTLTGEPVSIPKYVNSLTYAGTILEEGNISIKVLKNQDDSKLNEIIRLISESEENKSLSQVKAEKNADYLVKYTFLGSIFAFLFTKNIQKAKSLLMVDYSCALKLTIPIAIMTAMKEAYQSKVIVKGGKYLELLSESDTIVFDKTGTLTVAAPKVKDIIIFGNYSREECLKYAACLEEHFPHSVANAIVQYVKDENIKHSEMHTTPEYVIAHGIASTIDDKKVLIGSEHFIFEDEKIKCSSEIFEKINELKERYSIIYLAYDNNLAAAILIEDSLREDAKKCIDKLRKLKFNNISMLTGDSENAAKFVANTLNLDYYKSQVLPDDKYNYVDELKQSGHKVIMIGDGINDAIALSHADVGISMFKGADIAREISDISIADDNLMIICDIIELSKKMKKRIHSSYRRTILINTTLIILGFFSIINNMTSATLHNSSTIAGALLNMRNYK